MNKEVAERIEQTLIDPFATAGDVEVLCRLGQEERWHGICLPSCWVDAAYEAIEQSDLKICCLVGFPFGTNEADVKRFEAETAVDCGAHEIDVVMNLARFKERGFAYVLRELRDIAEAADERSLRVIVEAARLTPAQLTDACQLVLDSGAHFISTSTGFNGPVAGPTEIRTIRELVGPKFGIKASGLPDFENAAELIEAGATRLGNAGLTLRVPQPSPGAEIL